MEKPKVLAYYPLLYGKEYLKESIQSIDPLVDEIYIIYSPKPTFGHSTNLVCPDSEEELKAIAQSASDKVMWFHVKNGFRTEGEHRNFIYEFSAGFDLVLAVDADEVWDTADLERCLNEAMTMDNRYIQVDGFINFWRSFNHVCLDHFKPVRITNLKANNHHQYGTVRGRVYHFSLAQSEEIVRYKWTCHGHQDELRANWLEEKYFGWQPGMGDLHPTSIGLWNAADFDKETLPESLKQHPNFNKETI
jgi:hypothetical protein